MLILLGRKWAGENCPKSEGLKRTGGVGEKSQPKGPKHVYYIGCWENLGKNYVIKKGRAWYGYGVCDWTGAGRRDRWGYETFGIIMSYVN